MSLRLLSVSAAMIIANAVFAAPITVSHSFDAASDLADNFDVVMGTAAWNSGGYVSAPGSVSLVWKGDNAIGDFTLDADVRIGTNYSEPGLIGRINGRSAQTGVGGTVQPNPWGRQTRLYSDLAVDSLWPRAQVNGGGDWSGNSFNAATWFHIRLNVVTDGDHVAVTFSNWNTTDTSVAPVGSYLYNYAAGKGMASGEVGFMAPYVPDGGPVDIDNFSVSYTPVPEPAVMSLFATAGLALLHRRRR